MATATPTPLSQTPTAPLPTLAVEALRRLELAFIPVPLDVVWAVTRYEVATARYDELIARPASSLSGAESKSIGEAQQTIAEAFGVLAEYDRLDLIAPAETASRYRQADQHCRRLAASADFDAWADTQDEMAMCLYRLREAGRLDLVEVA